MPWNLVSPVLVGRDVELAALMAAFDAAAAGQAAHVLLGGEAGVGKTRLLDEAAGRARGAGARVLMGSCVELGGEGLPFTPLADALRSLVQVTPAEELYAFLGPARSELARLVPELDPDAALSAAALGEGGTARLLELVLGVVQRLASDRPLLLVIEDLHWADRSTLDLVTLLVRALRDLRVLVVVSFRSDELHRGHPLRPLVTSWERVRSVQRVELERFSADEVAAQLEGILGSPAPAHLLELVYDRSEGNAFLVEEIVGAVQSGADANHLPVSLRDVLLARAERLSPFTQGLLRVAAAGGRSVPDRLLAAVAAVDEPGLDSGLREAVEHHLLVVDQTGHGYEFRHALTRDAIYGDTLPRERVRIHAAYADALSEDPALAESDATVAAALALHWSAALDLPRAVPACVEAARLAAGYAPAEALRHLERALEMWPRVPDAAERCGVDVVEVLRRAGVSAYAAGALDRATALLDEALTELPRESDPERRALLLEARAAALLDLGRQDEATAALELAASLLPAERPTVARALVLSSLGSRRLIVGDWEAASLEAERAVEAAQAAGAREQEANARITLGCARAYLGESEAGMRVLREGIELAEEVGEPAMALRGYVNLSDVLDMLGRHEEAAATSRHGLELARRVGMTRNVVGVFVACNLAESLFHLGRWAESERVLTSAVDAGVSAALARPIVELRGTIRAMSGRYDEAGADLDASDMLPTAAQDDQFALQSKIGQAELARGRGDLGAAREHVRQALEVPGTTARYRWPLVWLGLRLEAEAGDAAPERVTALNAIAEGLPTTTPPALAYQALAAAEAARAAAEQNVDWVGAVEVCRAAQDPHLIAYALIRQAEGACAAGDRDRAAALLGEAARLAATVGAEPLLAEARSLARRARVVIDDGADGNQGAGADGFGLTDREREVLELLAEGRSNPQIAQALFISPKTASVHVSNILGKLGVASRGEAAAVAHRLGLDLGAR